MPRYQAPRCQAPLDGDADRICGHAMRPLGEREPSFGPNWRPGHWVFLCPYCGAVRAISDEHAGRYAGRT
jgi:hypothetical protein